MERMEYMVQVVGNIFCNIIRGISEEKFKDGCDVLENERCIGLFLVVGV